ncbi:ArsR family transcriptional regulator, partial [Escherichia coli]
MINDILTEDRRLVILRSLMDCNNEANESILQDCLDAYGH